MSGADDVDLPLMPDLDEILRMPSIQFVRNLYRRLLVREPEAGGISFYLRRMREGFPRIQILAEIAASKEARDLAVNPPGLARALMLYRLSRLPLVGWFVGRMLGVEGSSRYEARLQALEAILYADFPQADRMHKMPVVQRRDLRALIANSSLFDADWYRQQIPVLDGDIDLVDHYLDKGGFEGRPASEGFDGEMYLARYFDVRRSGMNPLVHFLLHGKMEGRRHFTVAESRQLRQRHAISLIDRHIHCLKVPTVSGEVAVFVTRSIDGEFRPFVRYYLGSLIRQGIGVIPIIATDRPMKSMTPESIALLNGLFVSANQGDTIAAWAHVLRFYPVLFSAPILYLLDDSTLGPFNEGKFGRLIERIRSSDADMIELADKDDTQKPVRSLFRALKPGAVSSVAFIQFVNETGFATEKVPTVQAGTGELAAHLRASGLKVEDLCASPVAGAAPEPASGALLKWEKLVGSGFPFIDIAVLREARGGDGWSGWQQLLEKEGCNMSLLEDALADGARPDSGEGGNTDAGCSRRAILVEAPSRVPSLPLRVAFIGPWNFDGSQGVASRGYLLSLWQTEFLLNVHPIRNDFHHHQRIAPTVDCRSFSGDADLAIVNLNPDEWPRLLAENDWEMLAHAGKVVGAWACDKEKIPASWHPAIDMVDAIWAPSRYCSDLFERSTKVAVEVIPQSVDIRRPYDASAASQLLRDKIGISADQHVIISSLDPADSPERQNLSGLLTAYEISGLSRENWVLLLCAGYLSDLSPEAQHLRDKAAATPGVILVETPLDPVLRSALLNTAAIYASPHRSEYTGLAIAEAMAYGKVVVATDFGGGRDVLDATCGFPVPYVLRPMQDGLCAEVDTANLAGILRKAAEKIVAGDLSIGQAAEERLGLYYSPSAIAQSMQRAVATLLDIR